MQILKFLPKWFCCFIVSISVCAPLNNQGRSRPHFGSNIVCTVHEEKETIFVKGTFTAAESSHAGGVLDDFAYL